MNILLLGHRGYLGSYLYQHIPVDTLDDTARKMYSNKKTYDYIINCIGKPSLEYCEKHIKETDYSNWLILRDIKKFYPTSKLINFSSYYVYDDDALCTEKAKTTTMYNYCRQKLLGEKEVVNGISFRIGKLFGNIHANQNKLTEHILTHNDLTLDSVLFNPTSVQQVLSIVTYELQNNTLSGIYNLANKGIVSHYDYGVFINDYLHTRKNIQKISKVARTFSNYGKFLMSIEKLNKAIPLTDWKDDMKAYLNEVLITKKNNNIISSC